MVSEEWARQQVANQQAQQGGNVWPSQDVLQYLSTLYGWDVTGAMATMTDQRLLDEFDRTLERLQQEAQLSYQQAVEVANIYAGAQAAAAAEGRAGDETRARATVEAAQAAAQAAIEASNIAAAASRYDSDTRLKIAKMQTTLERQRIAAVELARPGDWQARVGFFRGQTPEQAEALRQYGGGPVFGGQMPVTQEGAALPQLTAPQPATAVQPALTQLPQPTAIVGEGGEEAVTVTPQGLQITPLQQQQAQWLRGQGVPQMQAGGFLPYFGGYTSGRSGDHRMPTGGRAPLAQPTITPTPRPALPPVISPVRTARQRLQGAALPVSARPGQRAVTGAAGAPGATVAPAPTPGATPAATTPIDELPFLQAARAGGQFPVAPFQEWTGPTTKPEIGITTPVPPPWQYNLVEFQNMARPEQAMLAATWRGFNMIAGETEEEMIANAYEAMRRSAWTGAALPFVTYGGR